MDVKILTDEQLQQKAFQNDKFIDELISRYLGYIKSKARTFFIIGADSEDLIQEGMIGLYKAIKDFSADKNVSFKSFAKLCIDRQVITAIKTANRDKHKPLNNYVSINQNDDEGYSVFDTPDTTFSANPEDVVMLKEIKEVFSNSLNKVLTKEEKRVFMLYISGESYNNIALKFGKKPKNIDNTLQKIKKKLIKEFNH